MAVWKRSWIEQRTYFNTDTALIKEQASRLTIKLLGITLIDRNVDFNAEAIDNKSSVGFKK